MLAGSVLVDLGFYNCLCLLDIADEAMGISSQSPQISTRIALLLCESEVTKVTKKIVSYKNDCNVQVVNQVVIVSCPYLLWQNCFS